MCSLNFAKVVKYIEGFDFEEFFNYRNVDTFLNYLNEVSIEYRQQEWACYYGATKLVIIINEEDYVIKIPFNSTENWNDDYDENPYGPFYGAPAATCWDYCEVEKERFALAKENHFDKFFAETVLSYVTNNDIRIYTQPKCEICSICPARKTNSNKNFKFFREWYDGEYVPIDSVNWLNTFIDFYGLDALKNFLHFLEKNDWADDLSNNNIGFYKVYPVLIDYSSYWE